MKKKVIIVGGGFGGLSVAKILGNSRFMDIVLLDRRNHHLFQPLLYQVAMAGLSPADIAVPIRSVLSRFKNIQVYLAECTGVDLENKKIQTDFKEIQFDYLVLACGANHSYFGSDHWEPFAPGLKTLEQATEIRRRVLLAFERAEREEDSRKRKALQTFIIVGGGPTGVELAGALGEMSRFTLTKDFIKMNPRSTRVILVEGGTRILPTFDSKTSIQATRDLESLGVQVWTNSLVTQITAKGVEIGKEFIESETVIWAAGVGSEPLNKTLGVECDRQGKIIVESDLSIKNVPSVFVIGDQSHSKDSNGAPLPGVAPVALQQGRFIGKLLKNEIEKNRDILKREKFIYLDKGMMATIGRKKAVVEVGRLKISGLLAWMIWLFVHIFYLITYRNRMKVLLEWVWSYFAYKKGARIITDKNWQRSTEKNEEIEKEKKK